MPIDRARFRTLLADESGQDLIDYALVAALIGLGCAAAMSNLSHALANLFSAVSSRLNSAT